MRLTRRTICALVGALIFFAVIFVASAPVFATSFYSTNTSTSRGTATSNAIKLSANAYPYGAPAAVVASADDWTQSVGAGVLARAYGGPVLLSSTWSLSDGVGSELRRLKPTVVFVAGLSVGTAASIDSAVSGLYPRPQVVNLTGSDVYQTAASIARQVKAKLGTVAKVVIVPSDRSGGVLAATATAAANGWPLLLTPVAGPFPEVSDDVIEELGATSGILVGTTVAPTVSGFSVEKTLTGTVSSSDPDGRYSLCARTAEYAVDQGYASYSKLGLTEAYDRPGGIVVSSYVARENGLLALTSGGGLPQETISFMNAHGRDISQVSIVGLSWAVVRQVKSLNAARVYAVTPNSGPSAGGTTIVLTGTRLETATSVIIGKNAVPAADWRIDSSTQLTITATPEVFGAGPAEVIIQNYWNRSPARVSDLYTYEDGTPALPGERVVNEAIKYLGVPYLWAGASPSTGFDCSGLAMYVYQKMGISLPHYSRAQSGYGLPVSKDELLPGDLVFFYNPISHVGIYIGNGLMINAPRSGDLVTIENVYRSSYNTARRLIWPYTRYSDNDSRLSAVGAWATSYTSTAAGGSFRYLNSPGLMTVKFNGTYLGWIGKKAPQYGKAKVTVDGGAPVTVDLYSSTSQYQKSLWDTGILSPGLHTVIIDWTGTKNSSASGYYIGVDGFDVLGELVQAPVATRYQQTDPRLAYEGSWSTWYTAAASGGGFYFARSPAKATIAFEGTYLAWVAQKGPLYGQVSVSVDGDVAQTVDLYSPSYLTNTVVYRTPMLAEGPHTVTIESTGAKNPAATMDLVSIDAIDVVGELTDANLLPPGSALTRYEQTDPRLAYEGSWSTWYTGSASGGNFYYALSPAKATIAFEGTYLAWVAQKGPLYGQVSVSVDGDVAETVDLYSPSYLTNTVVYRTPMLAEGPHTVTIESTGAKNPAATMDLVSIDAIDVVGELLDANSDEPDPGVTRYEQTDSRIGYTGYWNTADKSASSGGSFAYSTTPSVVVVSFTGTSLDWLTEKGKYYGLARVKLDDDPFTQVDLYSATTMCQERVYSTGELEDTDHTLTIEWTGSAHPYAVANAVGIDAFDIAGELTEAPGLTRYEENASGIAYAGTWAPNSWGVPASAGRSVVTNTPSSSVTMRFDGTYVSWVTKQSPYYGHAMVFLDGAGPDVVDLYNPTEVFQQDVWSSGILEPGPHTVTVQWSYGRNKAALGTYLSIDAFDIMGTLAQAEPVVESPETKVVVIDPGHQAHANYDLEPVGPGSTTMKAKVSSGTASVNNGSPESELNLALGLRLRGALQSYGIEVVLTRDTQEVDISNAERAQLANAAEGDLFVRIHADGVSDSAVNGVLVLYPATISGWTDDIAPESARGASIALQELVAATGARSRGLSMRSDISGFNWSDVPVFLAEVGVMTNPTEDALLATDAYRGRIVSGLTGAILCSLDYY